MSRKGGTGGGGWGHPQGDMYTVAAVKAPWFALGGPILDLAGEGCLGSEQVFDNQECSLLHAC